MVTKSRRAERLERVLESLLEIHALSPGMQPAQFCAWLDLAITEARTQLEKVRTGTLH